MKSTFHKWVLNVMTAPNPTQYTKFDKYMEKQKNGPKWGIRGGSGLIALAIVPSWDFPIGYSLSVTDALFSGLQDRGRSLHGRRSWRGPRLHARMDDQIGK